VWEVFEPIAKKYVGEMRCHDCGRAYLYQDDQSHSTDKERPHGAPATRN
jgi:hypothetical protein